MEPYGTFHQGMITQKQFNFKMTGRPIKHNVLETASVKILGFPSLGYCQAQVQSPKVKTKRTLADTKITWATTSKPTHPTPNF